MVGALVHPIPQPQETTGFSKVAIHLLEFLISHDESRSLEEDILFHQLNQD